MKGMVFGEKVNYLEDGLGFLQALSENLGTEIEVVGAVVKSDDIDLSVLKGFTKLYVLNEGSTESYAKVLIDLYSRDKPDVIVGPQVKNGVEVMARVASELSIPMITEVYQLSKVNGDTLISRQIMGGRALALYQFKSPIVATIALKRFKPRLEGAQPVIEEINVPKVEMEVVEVQPKEKGAVDIEAAEIVVGVGRGFRSKEDLKLAFELAELLNGEVGCSRPIAADLQWLSEDRWIGISGKKIKGKLYLSIGISGAPQHIMAASDVKVIVAINKDKNAPIFTYADYGVVADLYQFVPVLIERLKAKLKK